MQAILSAYLRDRILFVTALLIYAVFSSPTPDSFGAAEAAILFLMIASLRVRFAKEYLSASILALYGLSVPLLISFVQGYPLNEIVRDTVPFIFLLMPVLYAFRKNEDTKLLTLCVIAIGLIFSVRSFLSFGERAWSPEEWLGSPPDLLYLANSPEVLFSCLALFCFSWQAGNQTLWQRIIIFILACVPLLAMASLMQRASLLYISVLAAIGFIYLVIRKQNIAIAVAIVAGIIWVFAGSFFEEIFRQISFKTQIVGLNSRAEEWLAVYYQVSQSAFSFLFGLGWGAEFENPAVGGLRVSFTHSLVSSLFLKTGLTGVIIFLAYAFSLLRKAWPELQKNALYFYALSGPLLIGLCLYASYKSLGYGLLLLILGSLGKGKKLVTIRRPVP